MTKILDSIQKFINELGQITFKEGWEEANKLNLLQKVEVLKVKLLKVEVLKTPPEEMTPSDESGEETADESGSDSEEE
jgi:hypothetical protein